MPAGKEPLADENTSLNGDSHQSVTVPSDDVQSDSSSFVSRNRNKITAVISVAGLAAVAGLSFLAGRESVDEQDQRHTFSPGNSSNATTVAPMTSVPSNVPHPQMNTFFLSVVSYAINSTGAIIMTSTVDMARFNLRKMLPSWLLGNPEQPTNPLSDAFQAHFVASHIYWPLVEARNVSCPDRPHAVYDGRAGCGWSVQSMSALEEYDAKYAPCYKDMENICMETVSTAVENNCTSEEGCSVNPDEPLVIDHVSFATEFEDVTLPNGENFTGVLGFNFTLGIDGGEPFNATTNIENLSGFRRFVVELGSYNNKTINGSNPFGATANTENPSGMQRAANFFSSFFFRSGSHGVQLPEQSQAGVRPAQNP